MDLNWTINDSLPFQNTKLPLYDQAGAASYAVIVLVEVIPETTDIVQYIISVLLGAPFISRDGCRPSNSEQKVKHQFVGTPGQPYC